MNSLSPFTDALNFSSGRHVHYSILPDVGSWTTNLKPWLDSKGLQKLEPHEIAVSLSVENCELYNKFL